MEWAKNQTVIINIKKMLCFQSACLSDCLLDYSKSYKQISVIFLRAWVKDQDLDPGFSCIQTVILIVNSDILQKKLQKSY